jgi:peptidoglycan/xylan/chitin deacetylase (PgdA/CDA1 family)
MYLVKTPFWIRWIYPGLTWNKSRKEKTIYLTFDDGPIPEVTPFVLNTLKTFGVKATFFCIGDNVCKHPEIFNEVVLNGHRIGNHTFNHLKGWITEDEFYIDNIKKCAEVAPTNLFRPPYGRIKKSQVAKLKELKNDSAQLITQIIMWDVLSGDFDLNLKPEKCLQNVLKYTENGSIVVFHDSLKAQARLEYTLPRALEFWKIKGFNFEVL